MGHRLTKITTRTGDAGDTGLGDGARVGKDARRVQALGEVDELNSALGVLLAEELPDAMRAALQGVQQDLFDVGGELSIPGHRMVSAAQVERLAAEKKMSLTTVQVPTELHGMHALEDGRADAVVAPIALLLGQISRSADPARFKVVGDPLLMQPYACVLPKGDPEYKQLVDATLAEMMRSGEMAKLHAKWFEAPIPPYRRALDLPLNDATRTAFASPNDRPLQ